MRVIVKNASVSYPVFDGSSRSLKIELMRGLIRRQKSGGQVEVPALVNISFSLKDGERLGLVGRNGCGKTTLLRTLGGLAAPKSGMVEVNGRVVTVIDRAIGIHPDMSGIANIELPLRLLGATTEEVEAAKAEIPEFTGLGSFIHLPFRTYSEGMKARLIFALCTAIHADVLILDEWLGAGDIDFVEKAQRRLTNMLDSSRVVVLASHSLDLIRQVCTKVAWIDKGKIRMMGDPNEVCAAYETSVNEHALDPA
jgi:ABC-type polysaccharide/polyol phosphate transport system ATPase subunit